MKNKPSKRISQFETYRSRLALEGKLKATVLALIAGFSITFIVGIVSWFLISNLMWLSLIVLVAVTGICFALFYFTCFIPTSTKIAERIDRLGLEERLITMLELEKDESFIALRQREDAKQRLSKFNRKQIKFRLFNTFRIPIIALAVVSALSIIMVTASTVYAVTYTEPPPELPLFSVEYEVEIGNDGLFRGRILENYVAETLEDGREVIQTRTAIPQAVKQGDDAGEVWAEPFEGFVFDSWSDGILTPQRIDKNIQQNLKVYAIFTELFLKVNYKIVTPAEKSLGDRLEELGLPRFDDDRDKYSIGTGYILGEAEQLVRPGTGTTMVLAVADEGSVFFCWSDEAENADRVDLNIKEEFDVYAIFLLQGDGAGGGGGDGQSGEGAEEELEENPAPPDTGSGAGGGGIPNNQINDGQTNYRDVYQAMYEQAMRIIADGGEIPDHIKKIIEAYYGKLI